MLSTSADVAYFYSLLLLVEAKFDQSVGHARAQLIVYLASLRRLDCSEIGLTRLFYGLATDGYVFVFVKISHDGTVMISRQFSIQEGDMKKVLGCLKYILEFTESRSPKSTP